MKNFKSYLPQRRRGAEKAFYVFVGWAGFFAHAYVNGILINFAYAADIDTFRSVKKLKSVFAAKDAKSAKKTIISL